MLEPTQDTTVDKIIARCIICSSEFTDAQLEDATSCPECGTRSIPLSPDADVTVKINWHELRVLTIWAENWARQCDARTPEENGNNPDEPFNMMYCVMTMAQRLQAQHPERTKLTLFSEVRELREHLAKERPQARLETSQDLDSDALLGLED